MAIETTGDLVVALLFSFAYIVAAIYFIWVILPIWFGGPRRDH